VLPEAHLQLDLLNSQLGCQDRLLFSIQKRHPYTGILNSETSETVNTRFYIVEML